MSHTLASSEADLTTATTTESLTNNTFESSLPEKVLWSNEVNNVSAQEEVVGCGGGGEDDNIAATNAINTTYETCVHNHMVNGMHTPGDDLNQSGGDVGISNHSSVSPIGNHLSSSPRPMASSSHQTSLSSSPKKYGKFHILVNNESLANGTASWASSPEPTLLESPAIELSTTEPDCNHSTPLSCDQQLNNEKKHFSIDHCQQSADIVSGENKVKRKGKTRKGDVLSMENCDSNVIVVGESGTSGGVVHTRRSTRLRSLEKKSASNHTNGHTVTVSDETSATNSKDKINSTFDKKKSKMTQSKKHEKGPTEEKNETSSDTPASSTPSTPQKKSHKESGKLKKRSKENKQSENKSPKGKGRRSKSATETLHKKLSTSIESSNSNNTGIDTAPTEHIAKEIEKSVMESPTESKDINQAQLQEEKPHFECIDTNIYLFERKKSKSKKETKRMVCDCILTKEERSRGMTGCGEDCLNRMLMIECGSRCPLGDHCSNKRFQQKNYAKVEPFKTAKKGWGLRAMENIAPFTFIMEYVGEVIDPFEFHKRVEKYARQKQEHYFFMALKSDEIIDATTRGNVTRFINHSCEPNSVTQKWTVNGELRIGFFTIKQVNSGEEITFDYQLQRYGKKAQACYCGSENCRGFIGSGESANILTDGSRIPKKVNKQEVQVLSEDEEEFLEDLTLEGETYLLEIGGLRNRHQVLDVVRLMLRAENDHLRLKLIEIIMSTEVMAYLRLFIDYHGLQMLWSWMMEATNIELKARLLELLEKLPIPSKTMLRDSKVLPIVERWAAKDSPEAQQYLNIDDEQEKEKDQEKSLIKTEEGDANTKANTTTSESTESTTSATELATPTTTTTTAIEESNQEGVKLEESSTANVVEAASQEKISNTTELSKLSGKVVIKSKSKVPKENTTKKSVTIGFLAQKLLNHWKELKEVFRIPRLEREMRHHDEMQADLRTREDEERRAQGLPAVPEKRVEDDRDYTIAGILGNKRRCLKKLTDSSNDYSRRSLNSYAHNNNFSTSSNNQGQLFVNNNNNNININTPRLTKEEHRKMFEYSIAQSDYADALKRYHEDLAQYTTYRAQQQQIYEQLKSLQQGDTSVLNELIQYSSELNFFSSEQLTSLTNSLQTNQVLTQTQSLTQPKPTQPQPPLPQATASTVDQTVSCFANTSSYGEQLSNDYEMVDQTLFNNELDEIDFDQQMKDLIPDYQSPLIELFNFSEDNQTEVSPQAIDNVDFTQIHYDSDDFIESMEKKMFDEIYPPSGIYFITEKGESYYMSLPSDMSKPITVKENVTEPLPLSFTKQKSEQLPECWSYCSLGDHTYYYNNRKQLKQWHPPQDSQLDSFDDNQRLDLFDIANELNNASNSNSPTRKDRDTPNSEEDLLNEYKRKNVYRVKEQFHNKISQFVVKCLNPYMRTECTIGRITNNNDFKYLARKITHTVVAKEMKQVRHLEDLACNESVKHKTKEYVKRYMSRFGPVYLKADSGSKSPSMGH